MKNCLYITLLALFMLNSNAMATSLTPQEHLALELEQTTLDGLDLEGLALPSSCLSWQGTDPAAEALCACPEASSVEELFACIQIQRDELKPEDAPTGHSATTNPAVDPLPRDFLESQF